MFEGLFARKNGGDRAADATAAPDKPDKVRPSIGLALGGGAARGFAHIGVIRTLAAHGIVPDVIVGTSIGAVVGGCYAAGQLDNLEEWARSLSVRSIHRIASRDRGATPDRRINRRQTSDPSPPSRFIARAQTSR